MIRPVLGGLVMVVALGATTVPAWAISPDTYDLSHPAPAAPSPAPAVAGDPILHVDHQGVTVNADPSALSPNDKKNKGKVVDINLRDCSNTDTLCSISNLGEAIKGTFQFLANPMGGLVEWLQSTIIGGDTSNSAVGQMISGKPQFLDAGQTDNIFSRMWSVFLLSSGVLMCLAIGARIVRNTASMGKQPTTAILVESLPRAVFGVAAAGVSYRVMAELVITSSHLGGLVMSALVQPKGQNAGLGTMFVKDALTGTPPGFDPSVGLAECGLLIALLIALYVVALMVLRYVMLVFTIVTAPWWIAIGTYDTRNEFFQFAWKMFIGAAIAPLLLGICFGITFGIEARLSDGHLGMDGSLAGVAFLIGGLWFTGKVMHHVTFGAFRGHNFMSLVAAAEGGMLLHQRGPMAVYKSVRGGGRGRGRSSSGSGGRDEQSSEASAPEESMSPMPVAPSMPEAPSSDGSTPNLPVEDMPLNPRTSQERQHWISSKLARPGLQRLMDNGIWHDEISAYANSKAGKQVAPAEALDMFLASPTNAELAYETFSQALLEGTAWQIRNDDPEYSYQGAVGRQLERSNLSAPVGVAAAGRGNGTAGSTVDLLDAPNDWGMV